MAYKDIKYAVRSSVATITIDRPKVHNAFRGQTCEEMVDAFNKAAWNDDIGVIVLTGAGTKAFSSGGDQGAHDGVYDGRGTIGLPIEELHSIMRDAPKPVIAKVRGWCIGGGNVLATICDLTIAGESAVFGQAGPRMGSVDPGFGTNLLARHVGQKKAKEIWFLCRFYDAQEAVDMGLVNTVVPLADLERETVRWCREVLQHSPMSLRCLKAALNADCDGQAGLQELAGNATMMFYMTEEGQEGRNAFNEKRRPNFDKFPRNP